VTLFLSFFLSFLLSRSATDLPATAIYRTSKYLSTNVDQPVSPCRTLK